MRINDFALQFRHPVEYFRNSTHVFSLERLLRDIHNEHIADSNNLKSSIGPVMVAFIVLLIDTR